MKKIIRKNKKNVIITILMISMIQLFLTQNANAKFLNNEDFYLCYCDGVFDDLYYEDELLEIQYVKMLNDRKYPVYAENQEKAGITPSFMYYIKMNSIINNSHLLNILENGFPRKTIHELNCRNELEAYVLTQLAIYDEYYHYDLEKLKTKNSEELLVHAKQYILYCREINKSVMNYENNENNEITIEEVTEKWKNENEEYVSKMYGLINQQNIEKYTVSVDSNDIKVVNERNELQNEFSKNDKFKIIINSNNDLSFNIKVKGKTNKNVYVKGEDSESNLLGYIYQKEFIEIEETLTQYHEKDNSKQENEKNDEKKDITDQIVKNIKIEGTKKNIKKLPQTGV